MLSAALPSSGPGTWEESCWIPYDFYDATGYYLNTAEDTSDSITSAKRVHVTSSMVGDRPALRHGQSGTLWGGCHDPKPSTGSALQDYPAGTALAEV